MERIGRYGKRKIVSKDEFYGKPKEPPAPEYETGIEGYEQ